MGTKPLTATNPPSASSSVLDRRPWIIPVLLVLLPLIGHLPSVILGLSSNPIWTQSGAVLGVGPQLLAGWSFGDPNVGWTNQALGHLVAHDWLHGRIPWWNPYSGIGLPLAGEMQPAAFFLPFVLLLAFQGGMFWLEASLQVFAGVVTYLLLRRLGTGRSSALIGAILYQFNGTFSWVPNEANLNVMPFLPLLLLGIEYARDRTGGRISILVVALSIGGSIVAGFPEAAYINGTMALLWMVCRFVTEPHRVAFLLRVVVGGLLGLLLAGPVIVAFADFGIASSIVQSHLVGLLGLDRRSFAGFVVPYIFGTLANNLGSTQMLYVDGGMGGYCAAFMIPLAVIGLTQRRNPALSIILAIWLALSMGKTFAFPPVMVAMNAMPFMRDVEFFRYAAPSWELAMVVLVAVGLDEASPGLWRPILGFVATLFAIMDAIYLAWPWAQGWHWNAMDRHIMVTWLYRATGLEIIVLIVAAALWFTFRGETRRLILGAVLIVNTMGLFSIPQLSGVKPGRVDWSAIRFLRHHVGLGRFYSLGPIQPNYSAYFQIPSLDHNYSPIASNWVNYIEKNLSRAILGQGGIVFWPSFPPMQETTSINDINSDGRYYRFLGVNYIVTTPGVTMASTVAVPPDGSPERPMPLNAGESLTVHETASDQFTNFPPIAKLGVFQGNFNNTADGILSITLCADGKCGQGQRNLAESGDNSPFFVNLAPPVSIKPGEAFTATISHLNGTHGDAVWLWPHRGAGVTLRTGSGQALPNATIRLIFGKGGGVERFKSVYRDNLMQIWRNNGADPFYTTSGASCHITNATFSRLIANCAGRATLVRRELSMAGWHATDNGALVPVDVAGGIVQKIVLRPGINHVRFAFWPPYVTYAWIGFWLAVLGLLIILLMPRNQRFGTTNQHYRAG
ncbi:MAG: hypothetical protein B7Z58_06585 [Acidiphilium sp. 37-64-53]|uniref:hypothetical protein n=1 Tax=Acidiphilium TaxID=522 RepID=UPI000BD9870F|nr:MULTISPECIES: hypothetical protein [Acidiphilium]OYW02670.1 MAG: hypothetical protein B7Z58_06585 [Acidiphilium sp. 37-64-53]HQT85131.1 hypothetical protein [Acidiphilium rubrum]